jgi:8-oxo-dGTP pyrophosphatase MutT (NUDIX family)
MRTIERDIVGAFIFSKDGKVLLGYNRKGGPYPDQLLIPGGGIEDGETELAAVIREIREETGVDISKATISIISNSATGESIKTLRNGEKVFVKMKFIDFEVHLSEDSDAIVLKFEDDYADGSWYSAGHLSGKNIAAPTKATLRKLRFLS